MVMELPGKARGNSANKTRSRKCFAGHLSMTLFPAWNSVTEAVKDRQNPVAFPRLVAGADVSPLAGVDIEAGVTITALLGSLVVRPLQGSCARLLRAGEVTRADG